MLFYFQFSAAKTSVQKKKKDELESYQGTVMINNCSWFTYSLLFTDHSTGWLSESLSIVFYILFSNRPGQSWLLSDVLQQQTTTKRMKQAAGWMKQAAVKKRIMFYLSIVGQDSFQIHLRVFLLR